jgi:hypothetical protein
MCIHQQVCQHGIAPGVIQERRFDIVAFFGKAKLNHSIRHSYLSERLPAIGIADIDARAMNDKRLSSRELRAEL